MAIRLDYGYFSDDDREFIITRPDTPTPWINYLSNSEYCAMISNTAGGYSFHIDPRDRRILRYRYNNLPPDRPGRYLYIRDNKTGEYWSPSWQPTLTNLDSYECRHGLGYTKFSSSYSGIDSEVTYFVPLEENLEIWRLTLKNRSSRNREITLFSYAEFCLWQAPNDQNNLQSFQFRGIAKNENGTVLYHFFDTSTGYAFFTSNIKSIGHDCRREKFIGFYRDESNPLAVERGECFGSEAIGGNPIAAISSKLQLNPGDTKTVMFFLGVSDDRNKVKGIIKKYTDTSFVDTEFQKLRDYWDGFLNSLKVVTPDSELNTMINVWNPYQCKSTFDWSRYVSFYETGIGRGMGFRDCNQDILGVVHALPLRVRQRILDLAKNQFEDGKSYHVYYPLTGEGGYPFYAKKDMMWFSDDHLWLILSVSEYIKETGDFKILDEVVPFVNGLNGTLYEHLCKSIDFTLLNMGSHNLPLLGTADWNDPLSIPGPNNAAESVWTSMLFHKVLLELSRLSRECDYDTKSKEYEVLTDKTKDNINSIAWDGEWYTRAFTDSGDLVGSSSNNEGRIFLNTQSWAVISGIAPTERAIQCMDSVSKYLDTEYGLLLLYPAYSRWYPEIGGITSYPPGLKENASIWSHANAWAIIAECMLGRGDIAYNYYKKLAPPTKNRIAEIHCAEPYVYAQTIAGREHPNFGEAKQSWLTGTAAWMMKAATNWILGLRPDYHGLLIDPCIPKVWSEFTITRRFRNAVYEVYVKNPKNVSCGIETLEVDGEKFEGNLLPVFRDGKTHSIHIEMG
jgi:cellobiose phosphorylase